MNPYEQLLDEVVLRLAGTELEPLNIGVMGVQVKKLEQFKGQYANLDPAQIARIYVSFAMQRFGTEKEPTELLQGAAGQGSDLYFAVSIASKKLTSDKGIYNLCYLTNALLIGMPFSWGGKISAFSTELLTFDDKNTWHWQLLFRVANFPMYPIKDFSVELPLSDMPLKRIDIDSESCEQEVTTVGGNMIYTVDGDIFAPI